LILQSCYQGPINTLQLNIQDVAQLNPSLVGSTYPAESEGKVEGLGLIPAQEAALGGESKELL
jgi:hypothetical protein